MRKKKRDFIQVDQSTQGEYCWEQNPDLAPLGLPLADLLGPVDGIVMIQNINEHKFFS